jgi:hypothetical protein
MSPGRLIPEPEAPVQPAGQATLDEQYQSSQAATEWGGTYFPGHHVPADMPESLKFTIRKSMLPFYTGSVDIDGDGMIAYMYNWPNRPAMRDVLSVRKAHLLSLLPGVTVTACTVGELERYKSDTTNNVWDDAMGIDLRGS